MCQKARRFCRPQAALGAELCALPAYERAKPFFDSLSAPPAVCGRGTVTESGNQAISRMAACAAARRAMGTRKGLQDT